MRKARQIRGADRAAARGVYCLMLFTRGLACTSLAWGLVLGLVAARDADAQGVGPPGEERRPPLPAFDETPPEARRPILPPTPLAGPEATPGAPSGPRVLVRGFRIRGSSVFDDAELREVLAAYNGREIGSEELVEIRDALTRHYVEAGYVNSGALIRDQSLEDGIVEIQVVEGRLAAVQVSGQSHFREGPLRDRIMSGLRIPLDVSALESNLQLLQQDPRIARVYAQLLPTEQRGDALLVVRIEENSAVHLDLEASNYAPVAFGGYRGLVRLTHENLLGFGDTLETRYLGAEGLQRVGLGYDVPLTARGTLLEMSGEYSHARVVEEPFDTLDIKTDYYAAHVGVTHPLYRSPRTQLRAGFDFDWRRADTCLGVLEDLIGCDPFDFTDSGATGGKTAVSALRFTTDFQHVERNQVFAARSVLSVGVPVLGARGGGVTPDGEFVAWLGQLQWAGRFDPWGLQAIFRTDLQFANDGLPTLERIPVGGHASVRGYRENELVRDQAVISSLELRLPVWRLEGRPIVEVAPFFDFGYSNNIGRPTPGPATLASVGLGLRVYPHRSLEMLVYWGHQLESVPSHGSADLQDDGVQFRVDWRPF